MKNFKLLIYCTAIGLSSCSMGSNGAISISAISTGQCSPMIAGSCTITLTYNTNSTAGMAIGYNASPQNQPAFGIDTSSCIPQGVPGTQTCSFNVNYNANACVAGNTNETVTFSLGSVTSNGVVLSCTPF